MLSTFRLDTRLSKSQINSASEYIIKNPDSLENILHLLSDKNIQVVQNAAWILGQTHPIPSDKILLHMNSIIQILEQPRHPSVTRNIIRILQYLEIPQEYQGVIYEKCYNNIKNPAIPIAIRAFSITVCHHVTKHHPGLKNELRLTLEEVYQHESPAIKSRIKNSMNQLI